MDLTKICIYFVADGGIFPRIGFINQEMWINMEANVTTVNAEKLDSLGVLSLSSRTIDIAFILDIL